jgi:nitroreductase
VELTEALRTTGAVRAFDGRPVPDEVVVRVLDTARFAPSGGNRQAWRVVLVRDREVRRRLRDLYLPGWYEYLAQVGAGLVPWSPMNDRGAEESACRSSEAIARQAADGPGGFAEHFDRVPVLLALLADLANLATVDRDADHYPLAGGASVYPFAWSILLAARAEGLGGVLTTMALREEPAARELFGAPDGVVLAGIVALGYPLERATRLRRLPVGGFATVDRLDGPALGPS